MNHDREMQAALEDDGEKLRQLTGEDHGPFAMTSDSYPDLGGEDLPGPENDACEHDLGFDRETGPYGCRLELHGGVCVCARRWSDAQPWADK